MSRAEEGSGRGAAERGNIVSGSSVKSGMTQHGTETLVGALWLGWLALWIVTGLRGKEVQEEDWLGPHMLHMVLTLVGAMLLFSPLPRWGWLDLPIVPHSIGADAAGLVLVIAGIALGIWARFTLGGNWSSRVVLKQGHELVNWGPYARLRHPIYTGLLTAALGTAVVNGSLRGFLGAALAGIGFCWKAALEEALLMRHFGEAFAAHRRRTGFLLPRLH